MALTVVWVMLLPAIASAQAAIDNPQPGSVQTGANPPLFGWKCVKNGELTARFDGGPPFTVLYGSDRGDTVPVCQDDGKNGLVLPFNWNLLGNGTHTLELFDEGTMFAGVSFRVVTFSTEFLFGAERSVIVEDFPDAGADVEVSWDQAIQNFRLTDVIEPENCDPAYPTVCIPPSPPDLDCPDIPFTDFTVLPPDPHGFDRDEDGIGCET